jgi:hypothetical protein
MDGWMGTAKQDGYRDWRRIERDGGKTKDRGGCGYKYCVMNVYVYICVYIYGIA